MSGGAARERQAASGATKGRAHRQGDRARRALLAARRGAADRRGPRQAERPRARHAGDRPSAPHDRIEVDGEPLAARERTRLWLFNKPKGLVTTNRDPEGRPTSSPRFPPTCRAWSRSAGSTSTPRACCSSPMTAGSRASWSFPPPAGSALPRARARRDRPAGARPAPPRRHHRRHGLWRGRGEDRPRAGHAISG